MIESTAFNFLYPWFLSALPIIWFTGYHLLRKQTKNSWHQYCDPAYLKLLNPDGNTRSGRGLILLISIILSLVVIALSGPSWSIQKYPALLSANARVIVLDLSESMLVQDVRPDRLSQARKIIENIFTDNYNGETGFVVFAGAAFQVAPLTRDYRTLVEFLQALSPGTMPANGSQLELALSRAESLLSGSASGTGSIYVISDGVDDPQKAILSAIQLEESGHRLFVIPVGTIQGGPLIDSQGRMTRDSEGHFIISRADSVLLKQIANAGGGTLLDPLRLNQKSGFDLNSVHGGQKKNSTQMNEETHLIANHGGIYITWLLLPLALLLFRKNAIYLLMATVFTSYTPETLASESLLSNLSVLFQTNEQRAVQAFEMADFEQAAQLTSNPIILGAILFSSGDFEAAFEYFTKSEDADALFNQGNTLVHLGKYSEALTAYQKALSIKPSMLDAKHNIRLLKNYLKSTSQEDSTVSASESDQTETEESSSETESSRSGQTDGDDGNEVASIEAGIGASLINENVRVNEEQSEAAELALELFLRQLQQQQFNPDQQFITRWASKHTTDPSDFFKRKFLRDHRRNTSQGR